MQQLRFPPTPLALKKYHNNKLPNSLPSPSTNGVFPFSSLFFFFFFSMSSSSSTPPTTYLTNLGFGYSIAIALGFLFLLSTLTLSSYLCLRTLRNRNRNNNRNNNPTNSNDGVVLPTIIFVAEDDGGNQGDNDNVVLGLEQNVINSYPRFQYSKDVAGNDTTCSICLCEYKDSEMLRMMPECRHYFHICCLDSWLKLNGSCPVCRNSPMPTPLSTPLQEVVPLSQYAADRRGRR